MTDRDLWRFERACRDADQWRVRRVLDGVDRWTVIWDDCLETLRRMPSNSVDALVTDPPAAIAFMGRLWDKSRGGRRQWVAWLAEIMAEALRVLKPGAHAFVWALPRTSHWTATALEDAGFEIRDCFNHLFGSGMPKSVNVSKVIDAKLGTTDGRQVVHSYRAGGNAGTSCKDKGGTYAVGAENSESIELTVTTGGCEESRRWDGYGTGARPSAEHWLLVRKPLEDTVAANVMAHGCGAINVDACRVPRDFGERPPAWHRSGHSAKPEAEKIAAPPGIGIQCHPLGGWPPNVLLSHSDECWESCAPGCPVLELDGQGDAGGESRYFPQFRRHPLDDAVTFLYTAKPSRAERDRGLDGFKRRTAGESTGRVDGTAGISARAGAGRTGGARNIHPTVKSTALMRWLCRLVAPATPDRPNPVVVDIFCGSGSTGLACVLEGFRFIGIDLNNSDAEPYVRIARARIQHADGWTEPEAAENDDNVPEQRSLFE